MVLPLSVDSVILENVGHVVGGDEGVVDGDELDIGALERNPGHKPADLAETKLYGNQAHLAPSILWQSGSSIVGCRLVVFHAYAVASRW